MAYAIQAPNGRFYMVQEGGKGDNLSATKFRQAQKKLDPATYGESGGSRRSRRRRNSGRTRERSVDVLPSTTVTTPDPEGVPAEVIQAANKEAANWDASAKAEALAAPSQQEAPYEQSFDAPTFPRRPIQYDFPSERGVGRDDGVARHEPSAPRRDYDEDLIPYSGQSARFTANEAEGIGAHAASTPTSGNKDISSYFPSEQAQRGTPNIIEFTSNLLRDTSPFGADTAYGRYSAANPDAGMLRKMLAMINGDMARYEPRR